MATVAAGSESVTVRHGELPGHVKLIGNEIETVATVPTGIVLMFMPTISILVPLALALLLILSERTVIPELGTLVVSVHWNVVALGVLEVIEHTTGLGELAGHTTPKVCAGADTANASQRNLMAQSRKVRPRQH